MKKILAIAVVAIMTIALCIGASADFNIDRIHVNNNVLDQSADVKGNDPIEIAVGDKLYILGWAKSEGKLKEIVYSIDDGADVKCDDNYRDRPDVPGAPDNGVHAGIGQDNAAFELTGIDKLKDGTYKLTLKAVFEAGETETKEFNLKVGTGVASEGGETPATSESKAALTVTADKLYELFEGNTGSNTVTAEKKDGYVTFTAGGEDPFFAFAEPLNPGVEAKYAVVKYRYEGEGERTIDFYLQIAEPHARAAIETDGEWHYVIIDCSAPYPDSMDTLWDGTIARLDPLSGNGITDTSIDIASIEFFASEADAQAAARGESSQGGEQGGTTPPPTADAAVIAVAAVACIALAGVVVAKKVK